MSAAAREELEGWRQRRITLNAAKDKFGLYKWDVEKLAHERVPASGWGWGWGWLAWVWVWVWGWALGFGSMGAAATGASQARVAHFSPPIRPHPNPIPTYLPGWTTRRPTRRGCPARPGTCRWAGQGVGGPSPACSSTSPVARNPSTCALRPLPLARLLPQEVKALALRQGKSWEGIQAEKQRSKDSWEATKQARRCMGPRRDRRQQQRGAWQPQATGPRSRRTCPRRPRPPSAED